MKEFCAYKLTCKKQEGLFQGILWVLVSVQYWIWVGRMFGHHSKGNFVKKNCLGKKKGILVLFFVIIRYVFFFTWNPIVEPNFCLHIERIPVSGHISTGTGKQALCIYRAFLYLNYKHIHSFWISVWCLSQRTSFCFRKDTWIGFRSCIHVFLIFRRWSPNAMSRSPSLSY
jgi:hypothetical protein